MGKYALGKRSLAISDRSGMAFPYTEMVREWNGSLVHTSEYEPKQPQLEPNQLDQTHKLYLIQDHNQHLKQV